MSESIMEVKRRASEMDARRQYQIGQQITIINRLLGNTNKAAAQAEELRRLSEELAAAKERLDSLRSRVLTAVNGDQISVLCAQRVRNAVEESYL